MLQFFNRSLFHKIFIGLGISVFFLSSLSALAADPTFDNVQLSQGNLPSTVLVDAGGGRVMFVNIPGYSKDEASLNIQYDYNSGMIILLNGKVTKLNGQVKEQIMKGNQVIYEFGSVGADSRPTGLVSIKWDGTCNVSSALCQSGNFVEDGKYTLSLKSTNTNDWSSAVTYVSGDITVINVVPTSVKLKDPMPLTTYDAASGEPFTVTFAADIGTDTTKASYDGYLTISGPEGQREIKENYTTLIFGYPTIAWDGMINNKTAVEGNYHYNFVVKVKVGDFTVSSNELNGDFTVKYAVAPSPSPNPPSPSPNPPSPNPVPPSPTPCGGFTDVKIQDCKYVEYVKSIGAMTGYASGDFGPDNNLNRAEIAKIVEETFKKFDSSKDYCKGANPFPDVTPSLWAFQYICRGKQLGMITGYLVGVDAGFHRPARNVNRAEFLAMVLRNLSDSMIAGSSYNDVGSNDWFNAYAKFSYDNKLFNGTYLYATQPMKRIEVAQVLYRLHELNKI